LLKFTLQWYKAIHLHAQTHRRTAETIGLDYINLSHTTYIWIGKTPKCPKGKQKGIPK